MKPASLPRAMGVRVLAFVKESRIRTDRRSYLWVECCYIVRVVVKQALGLTTSASASAAAAATAAAIGGRQMMRWRFSYKIGVGIRSFGILLTTTEGCCYKFSPDSHTNKWENGTGGNWVSWGRRGAEQGEDIPPFPLALLGVAWAGGGR